MNGAETLIQHIELHDLWTNQLELKRSELVSTKGMTNSNLYFITEGSLRVFINGNNEELTLRFGYKNNIVSALDSFITDKPTDFYIEALKKTNVKVISKKVFIELINSSTDFFKIWNQLLQQIVLQQLEREKDILTTSPIERYNRVLERSPQLFQEIPNKYIANYLRMTPETLSRLKKS